VGALDISSGVDNHKSRVRPARPLRHPTNCMPAYIGDRYNRAPKVSGTVDAVDAVDINNRATGNAVSLSSRDGNDHALELSRTVHVAGALDINDEVEGNGSKVRPSWPLEHSTHCTPASGGEREMRIVVLWLWQERHLPPLLPNMPARKAIVGTKRVGSHQPGHPLRRFFPAIIASSRPRQSIIRRGW
jgi:hypothetical protein